MIVVFEGNDGSGKSTLIQKLYSRLAFADYTIISSEGPPKYEGEMNDRILRYLNSGLQDVLYDRHPCVSNPIYDVLRKANDKPTQPIDNILIRRFYDNEPFFVYCDPINKRHDVKFGEDPDHIEMIERNKYKLTLLYREWAIAHAHIIYRIGDDIERVISAISGVANS